MMSTMSHQAMALEIQVSIIFMAHKINLPHIHMRIHTAAVVEIVTYQVYL